MELVGVLFSTGLSSVVDIVYNFDMLQPLGLEVYY